MFLKDSEESMPQRNQRWSSIFLTHARLVYYSFNYLIGKSASAQAITKLGQPGKVGDKRNVLGVHAATHPHNLPWEGNLQVLGERTVGWGCKAQDRTQSWEYLPWSLKMSQSISPSFLLDFAEYWKSFYPLPMYLFLFLYRCVWGFLEYASVLQACFSDRNSKQSSFQPQPAETLFPVSENTHHIFPVLCFVPLFKI